MEDHERREVTHLLVIDFEATCDSKKGWVPEIIEFPAVLVAIGDPHPIAEFSTFVRPIERPSLTGFCTELTSITQADVDCAPLLADVLQAFEEWTLRLPVPVDDIMPVTCGDWDLKIALTTECARKGLRIPRMLQRWCNVKVAFSTVMQQVSQEQGPQDEEPPTSKTKIRAPGMAGMLNHLGLPLRGRHHRGIDDARNIASIAVCLQQRSMHRDGSHSPLFQRATGSLNCG
mmetsp:Transcript_6512/g.19304  ORF Transcript_6512/g.19304 Transcript_6512/m.19304 type:complete len:231 (+) Transcript_6512:87-779(+)